MDRFIPAQLACVHFVASERSLELHARRGNLPFRGETHARLYDADVLRLLFLPRSATVAAAPPGTLGSVYMGGTLAGAQGRTAEPAHRRRRRAMVANAGAASGVQHEAQEA